MSITPTEYDYNLLKSYAENGVDMIQVHEEWNDTIEKYGSDKWHSCDHEGMLKFIDLCHQFNIKIIPYCPAIIVSGKILRTHSDLSIISYSQAFYHNKVLKPLLKCPPA
jgi:hypothetical protein